MSPTIVGIIPALILFAIIFVFLAVKIIPQGEAWVVERLGKYNKTLSPGLHFIIPIIDKVRAKVTTRDIILDIPAQEMITRDNAVVEIDGVAFVNITDPYSATYGVEDVRKAIANLVSTTLRSIVGSMDLDEVLKRREEIKARLKQDVADDVAEWGVTVKTVEIQEIRPSQSMQEAMERQAAAERERRAMVTEAEGKKRATILEAEGALEAAKREAEAKVALAKASKEAIELAASAIKEGGENAAAYLVAESYIKALQETASSKNAKTILLPADIQKAVEGIFRPKG